MSLEDTWTDGTAWDERGQSFTLEFGRSVDCLLHTQTVRPAGSAQGAGESFLSVTVITTANWPEYKPMELKGIPRMVTDSLQVRCMFMLTLYCMSCSRTSPVCSHTRW